MPAVWILSPPCRCCPPSSPLPPPLLFAVPLSVPTPGFREICVSSTCFICNGCAQPSHPPRRRPSPTSIDLSRCGSGGWLRVTVANLRHSAIAGSGCITWSGSRPTDPGHARAPGLFLPARCATLQSRNAAGRRQKGLGVRGRGGRARVRASTERPRRRRRRLKGATGPGTPAASAPPRSAWT